MENKVDSHPDTVGVINDGIEISQTFKTNHDFQGVAVLIGTYDKIQVGKIDVTITDEDAEQVILNKSYYTWMLKDNSYLNIAFDKLRNVKKMTTYRIDISSDWNIGDSGITIWSNNCDIYNEGSLYVNGQEKNGDIAFSIINEYSNQYSWGMFFKRLEVIGLIYIFILLNCFVNVSVLYDNIFKYRLIISIALFVFCVANRFNFSSINMWDSYIQSGEGSEYVETVFGKARAIRSDEWLVTLPRIMSAEYEGYGKVNSLVNARETSNLGASGLYKSYSALAKPAEWGYYIFGTEYGLSFYWSFRFIFGFLFSFELCLLISNRKRLISLLGGGLIWFSAYNMWWSTVTWIITGSAAIVLCNYFLKEKKSLLKIFWAGATAIAAANFVVDLYPAWLVPAGYVYLFLLIWVIVINWKNIRQFDYKDWGIIGISFIFLCSIVGVFLYNYKDYMSAVMGTVYPGHRVSYGGFSITKLLGYMSSWMSSFLNYDNPSEMSCFYGVFPIALILGVFVFIKQKGRNLLLGLLFVPTILFTLYCVTPLPKLLVKITLLSYSTPERTVDILGFLMVLIFIIALSNLDKCGYLKLLSAILLSAICVSSAVIWELKETTISNNRIIAIVILGIVSTILIIFMISNANSKRRKTAMILWICLVFSSGINVNPIMVGTDAISSKPAAKEVNKIVESDPDAKWIALDNHINGNFLIACGAPTYNSVNYVPNMSFWHIIDPNGEYEEVYNRYAHVIIQFTNDHTTMEVLQPDMIMLKLSYNDFEKINVGYIMASNQIEDESKHFKLIYNYNNIFIYKVINK